MAQLIRKAIKVLLLAAQMKGHFAFENFECNTMSYQVINMFQDSLNSMDLIGTILD